MDAFLFTGKPPILALYCIYILFTLLANIRMNLDDVVKRKNSLPSKEKSNQYDENEVLAIFCKLWDGRWVVIISMIVALILGIIYLMIAPQKWTSTATVTLPSAGQVANYNATLAVLYSDNSQDKPSIINIQNQLFGRFGASMSALSSSLLNLDDPLTLNVKTIDGTTDSLNISFVASSAKKAQEELSKYINQVNYVVVKDYGDDIKRSVNVKTRELKNVINTYKKLAQDKKEHRIEVINYALTIAKDSNINKLQVNQADFLSDDTFYLLGSDALKAIANNEKSKPLEYDKKYYELQRALLALTDLKFEVENLQSYRYVSPADLPSHRGSPKKSIIIILSLILGAMIGSIIVLNRNVLTAFRKHD
ncbi:O-antigen lipopolysaccharide chain length regulator [Pantoea stewartii subsp. stewartii DC283]|uniref:Chain length determinant protein n=2 Tax=Pantoea stewartii subsp. stewartii DC283 TaxID=660596 RepID=H3REH6_PANSE|nr:O-antigen lipopolysaccharide chain length regulator [Pantoea stewartii subsp. stewartii DC283]